MLEIEEPGWLRAEGQFPQLPGASRHMSGKIDADTISVIVKQIEHIVRQANTRVRLRQRLRYVVERQTYITLLHRQDLHRSQFIRESCLPT